MPPPTMTKSYVAFRPGTGKELPKSVWPVIESAGVEVEAPKKDDALSKAVKKSEDRREVAFAPILVCSAMLIGAKVAFHADILTAL